MDIAALFAWCDLHVTRWRTMPVVAGFRSRPMYYDRDGFPIPDDGDTPATLVWARLRETTDSTLARDELPDGSMLSTVWLGLDHAVVGPPLIFETMRFAAYEEEARVPGSSRPYRYRPPLPLPDVARAPDEDTESLRYTTAEEALAAHHEIVRRFRLRLGH